ncbi:carbonic anhydrase [Lutibacter agarilyticus]|uniref:Carbonic anhydrase n=1 Tax=Lutibacter agarilyticus TaxID=1109740 RepID=A0A238VJK2_9FLAO|nr:carbonic anhydrase family protein [Lutibacter agarilyticus]SNR33883.1 carbonic anhydrase [Lutibacter agarilyticus]
MKHINNAIDKNTQTKLTSESVLEDLLDGNTRFVENKINTVATNTLVKQTVNGQYPKAIVLSCIDSRVPVETIFDQTIGDIFVARVAGNFENTDIIGSMEYACKVAGSKLIFVLGHESCGAIKAACDRIELGNITALVENIKPAVNASESEVVGPYDSSNMEFVNKTIENNVKLTINRILTKSPILKEMEENGEIKIMGGIYKLSDGKVAVC